MRRGDTPEGVARDQRRAALRTRLYWFGYGVPLVCFGVGMWFVTNWSLTWTRAIVLVVISFVALEVNGQYEVADIFMGWSRRHRKRERHARRGELRAELRQMGDELRREMRQAFGDQQSRDGS